MGSFRKEIRQGIVEALQTDIIGVNIYDTKISILETDKVPLINVSTPAEDVNLLGDDFLHSYLLTVLVEIVVKGTVSSVAVATLDDLSNLVRASLINFSNSSVNYSQFDLLPKTEETYFDQAEKKYFHCKMEFQVRYKSDSAKDISGLSDFTQENGSYEVNTEKPIEVISNFE